MAGQGPIYSLMPPKVNIEEKNKAVTPAKVGTQLGTDSGTTSFTSLFADAAGAGQGLGVRNPPWPHQLIG